MQFPHRVFEFNVYGMFAQMENRCLSISRNKEKKSYEIITFANPDSALVFHHEEQFVWLFEIVASGFVNSS